MKEHSYIQNAELFVPCFFICQISILPCVLKQSVLNLSYLSFLCFPIHYAKAYFSMIDDESFRNSTVAKIRAGVMCFAVTDFHFNNKNFQPSGTFSPTYTTFQNLRTFLTLVSCPAFAVNPIADRGMLCLLGTEVSFRPRGVLCTDTTQ